MATKPMPTKKESPKASSPTDSPVEPTEVPQVPYVGDGQEDTEARMQQFREGYEKLVQETQIGVQCLITPTGPSANLVDVKPKENEKPQ